MKTTLNAKELRVLSACRAGLELFVEHNGEDTVTLSQALDSNGWDDIWWYISSAWCEFTEEQQNDLHLIGCGWAERVLENFEKEFPEDDRPRKAIEAKKAFIKGEIDEKQLDAARSAAESAARSAAWSASRSAAWSASRSASRSAESAARSAARSAAWSAAESAARSAEMEKMTSELRSLFIIWEDNA